MTDEMILVPRAELLAWAKAWLNDYDPNDGTDCVTPFDTYLLKSPAEVPSAPYNRKRIAWELERTAMGDGYYGSALYAAKELPEATPAVRSLLDRWATGKERGLSDRTDLCAFALQIYAAGEESPSAPVGVEAGWIADGDTIPDHLIEAARDAIQLEFGISGTDGYYKRILVRVFRALAGQQGGES